MKTILRRALKLLTLRFLLAQFTLALVVTLLSALWLRIPDAGVFDLLLTLLLALIILTTAFGGEAFLLHRLHPQTPARRRILTGAAALLLAAIAWLAWTTLLDHLALNDTLRAGYLNSQLPAAARTFFTYQHIVHIFTWLWTTLRWLGTGLLLAAPLATILGPHTLRSTPRLIFSLTYWFVFLCSTAIATPLTDTLIHWTPGHGLPVELFSLILRLALITLADFLLIPFTLTTAAAILAPDELTAPPQAPQQQATPEP